MTKWSPRLSASLTMSEASYWVLDGGKRIGSVVRSANKTYVASTLRGKIGEFVTALEAELAIRAEAKKKARR
jgi:hypothetical protein